MEFDSPACSSSIDRRSYKAVILISSFLATVLTSLLQGIFVCETLFFLSSYSVTVRVKNHEAGVCLHQIRFAVKAGLTGTGTAADKGVQIAAVFLAVESDTDCLRHQLVFGRWVLPVFLVHGFGIAPFCAAVFLPASVVPACREVDTDAHSVAEKQNEDSFYTVLAKLESLRRVHNRPRRCDSVPLSSLTPHLS